MGKVDQIKAAKFDKQFQARPAMVKEPAKKEPYIDPDDIKVINNEGSDALTEGDNTEPTQAGFKVPTIALVAVGLAVVYFAFGKKLGIRK